MASKYDYRYDEPEEAIGGLAGLLVAAIQVPLNILLSRSARRAYLTSFLLVSGALLLLGSAVVAYTLFYWSYIPRIGFERTLYLQFDHVYDHALVPHHAHPFPYGIVKLAPDLVSNQQYDIAVELTLPRTPDNANAGNFMVEAVMSGPVEKGGSNNKILDAVKDGFKRIEADPGTLATSRRPAILPYRSRAVEAANTLTQLPWYILGWRQQDDKLRVALFENVQFTRGWKNVPSSMKVELQSKHQLQVYSAKVLFRARFRGLRWLMYNHRIISAMLFVNAFWVTELVSAALVWAAVSALFFRPTEDSKIKQEKGYDQIKDEHSDVVLSDTDRTFPSGVGQAKLRYQSPTIKQEDDDRIRPIPSVNRAGEADDEDDEDFFDSGIGTSMDSSATNVRRRRSKREGRESFDASMFPS